MRFGGCEWRSSCPFTGDGTRTVRLLFRFLLVVLLVLLAVLVLSLALVFFGFGEDVIAQLVAHVDHFLGTTRRATVVNYSTLDLVIGFGETAIGTQDEFFNISMDQILQDSIGVCTIDNGTVGIGSVPCLCPEFRTKEFVHFAGLTVQTECHIRNVRDGCLNAIARSFNLTENGWHLVTVLRVVDGGQTRNVDDGSSTMRHSRQLLVWSVLMG